MVLPSKARAYTTYVSALFHLHMYLHLHKYFHVYFTEVISAIYKMSMYFIFHTKFAFHYTYQHFCNTYNAFHIYLINILYTQSAITLVFYHHRKELLPFLEDTCNMAGIVKYVVFF